MSTRPNDFIDSILDILKAAGVDTEEDALVAGVRSLATDRKSLMDANGDLAEECRRLMPFEAESRVLREQLAFMNKLVEGVLTQATSAEIARERAAQPSIVEWGRHVPGGGAYGETLIPVARERLEARQGHDRGIHRCSDPDGHPDRCECAQISATIRRADASLEHVAFARRADGHYVPTMPMSLNVDDALYLEPQIPMRAVDLRRVLMIVAAYIDPSASISYGRFAELLAAESGLEGWSYSDLCPVLFNVTACTHPKSNDLDDLAGVGNTAVFAREICDENGIEYTPRCTCLSAPEHEHDHAPCCPKAT